MGAEHLQRFAAEPRAVGGYQEGRDAAAAGAGRGAGEDGVEVGLGGVGDPALLAGQLPTPRPDRGPGRRPGRGLESGRARRVGRAHRACREGEGRGVGAGPWFAERVRGHRAPGDDLGQPAGPLLGGAGLDHGIAAEGLEGARGARRAADATTGTRAGTGLGLRFGARTGRASPRVGTRFVRRGGEEAAQQAQLAEGRHQWPVHPSGRAALGQWAQPVGSDGAQRGAPPALLRIEGEGAHRHPSFIAIC